MPARLNDRDMMLIAIERAREGVAAGQTPFGAAIAKRGKLIAASHNEVWSACDVTAHAEVTAIRKACHCLHRGEMTGATIYSTTEPCPMCFAACHWAGISRIVFGATIADARRAGFHELTISNRRMKSLGGATIEIVPGFMREQCVELFGEFLAAGGRRRLY